VIRIESEREYDIWLRETAIDKIGDDVNQRLIEYSIRCSKIRSRPQEETGLRHVVRDRFRRSVLPAFDSKLNPFELILKSMPEITVVERVWEEVVPSILLQPRPR